MSLALIGIVIMGFLNYVFAGTMSGMVIAMGVSFLIGVYLYFSPPKLMA